MQTSGFKYSFQYNFKIQNSNYIEMNIWKIGENLPHKSQKDIVEFYYINKFRLNSTIKSPAIRMRGHTKLRYLNPKNCSGFT